MVMEWWFSVDLQCRLARQQSYGTFTIRIDDLPIFKIGIFQSYQSCLHDQVDGLLRFLFMKRVSSCLLWNWLKGLQGKNGLIDRTKRCR